MQLPVHEYLTQIEAILSKQNLVLQAQPGAGKSTLVPLHLLQASHFASSKIIMLEPRRIAARALAIFLAEQLGEQAGETVGYQVRNDKKIGPKTRLEIVTEGILTRKIQADPALEGYSLVIFDEFHERSLHTDTALILCKESQLVLREDLRILLMSATLDETRALEYLGDSQHIACPGRQYPVSIEYQEGKHISLAQNVLSAVTRLLSDEGCILVFLPGRKEIGQCHKLISGQGINCDVEFLHGSLSLQEQQRVLKKPTKTKRGRVILTTNIAQTSLTIDGVTAVIDSGLERAVYFDVKSGLSRLQLQMISQASAQQRSGRAGRTQAGHCIRLWSQTRHAGLTAYDQAEVERVDLSTMQLEMATWGNLHYDSIDWYSPPPKTHYQAAQQLNQQLGWLDQEGQLTHEGQLAHKLGCDVRSAAVLSSATTRQEKYLACIVAAILAEKDVLPAGCDFLLRVEHYFDTQNSSQERFKWAQIKQQANQFARRLGIRFEADVYPGNAIKIIKRLLIVAYSDRICVRRNALNQSNKQRYLMANGRGVTLRQDDPLVRSEWLLVCDCDGQNSDGQVYLALGLDKTDVQQYAEHQFNKKVSFEIDQSLSKVQIQQKTYLGAICLDVQQQPASREQWLAMLPELIKEHGASLLNWDAACLRYQQRCQWLRRYDENFANLAQAHLLATCENWLIPYIGSPASLKSLKKQALMPLLKACLDWTQQTLLDQHAPDYYTAPSGRKVAIDYRQEDAVVAIQLQEVFGELSSPLLAFEKTRLRFELLSPAKRVIQTTSDLSHFWQNSYFEVAKEMRGRYPKHRWPDKPLEASAGRSIKPKDHR